MGCTRNPPRAVPDFIEVAKMVTYSDAANRKRGPAGLRLERKMPKIVCGLYNVVADEKILFFVRD